MRIFHENIVNIIKHMDIIELNNTKQQECELDSKSHVRHALYL